METNLNEKALSILSDSITKACKRYVSSAAFDKTRKAQAVNVVVTGQSYHVQMQGRDYTLPSAFPLDTLLPCKVWVTMPCGSSNDMYISAIRR